MTENNRISGMIPPNISVVMTSGLLTNWPFVQDLLSMLCEPREVWVTVSYYSCLDISSTIGPFIEENKPRFTQATAYVRRELTV